MIKMTHGWYRNRYDSLNGWDTKTRSQAERTDYAYKNNYCLEFMLWKRSRQRYIELNEKNLSFFGGEGRRRCYQNVQHVSSCAPNRIVILQHYRSAELFPACCTLQNRIHINVGVSTEHEWKFCVLTCSRSHAICFGHEFRFGPTGFPARTYGLPGWIQFCLEISN